MSRVCAHGRVRANARLYLWIHIFCRYVHKYGAHTQTRVQIHYVLIEENQRAARTDAGTRVLHAAHRLLFNKLSPGKIEISFRNLRIGNRFARASCIV